MNKWQKVRLGDVCEIIGGGTPKTTNRDYWKGNIPWLSVADFNNENRRVFDTEKFITQKGLENSSTKLLNTNDIIISARGTVGALAQLARPMSFNQSCYGIRATENTTNDFLYYAIKNIIQTIKTNTHGSVFDTITRDTFDILTILLPPLPEQKRIAAILSALDDKIELNNRMNKNLEAQAQAIFKSWFVDFEPWGGVMPEDWKEGELGEIAIITMGQSPKGDTYNEDGNGTVFYQGRAEFGTRFPTRRLFTTAPNRMANENDILLSVRAPVGDYNIATERCCIGRGLAAIKPLGQSYAYCVCLMDELQSKFNQFNGEGTVFGSINKDSLNSLSIIIPTDKIFLEFEKIVSPFNNQIRFNYDNIQTLSTLRDTLLPKLMSGEIDLKEEE